MKDKIQNMTKSTKIVLGVLALFIVVGLIANSFRKEDSTTTEIPLNNTNEEQVVAKNPKKRSTPKNTQNTVSDEVENTAVDSRGYAELVMAYKDSTLQFGKSCQVRMGTQIHKMGTQILLDNRNDIPVSLSVGSDIYNLSAYGFKVISLNTEGKFMVNCNEYKNVATLTVQK